MYLIRCRGGGVTLHPPRETMDNSESDVREGQQKRCLAVVELPFPHKAAPEDSNMILIEAINVP